MSFLEYSRKIEKIPIRIGKYEKSPKILQNRRQLKNTSILLVNIAKLRIPKLETLKTLAFSKFI